MTSACGLLYLLGLTAVLMNSEVAGQAPTSADYVAQSICTTLSSPKPGWTYAIRRTCSGSVTCKNLCANGVTKTDSQTASYAWTCSGSLHVYPDFNQPAYYVSYPRTKVYNYASCDVNSCGPNYCCCFTEYP